MIDAERMLGSLVRNAMAGGGRRRRKGRRRRGRMGGLAKSGLGLGALGVAIAAFEHFTQQQPGATKGAASLPPVPGAGRAPSSAALPPLPGQESGSEPLPPLPTDSAGDAPSEALLLVRAMIAAANADHHLDDAERRQILAALDESGVGGEERAYLLGQIESPIGIEELVTGVTSPEHARQVYAASLMAIEVDSEAERNYLSRLAQRLELTAETIAELEGLLDDSDD